MKKAKNDSRLTVPEITTYSLGSLGREFSNNCVSAFFLVYLCVYQGLNPVIMTVAFVLAKLWDAANDPMLATIVNNSKKSRFGRYRPWILIGTILNAGTLVLMFCPLGDRFGSAGKYAFYIAMYVLWGMSFTVMDVPFWSMLPTIANTTEERNKVSSMAKLIGGLGGFLTGMIGTSFVLPNFSDHGMKRAYMILGAVAGVVMLVFVLFTVIFNREKYPVPHENVGLKYIFSMFKENDQLRAYAISYVLFATGTSIALSQILYLYVYCYEDSANFLNSSYSYTLFWVIACTGQGIAMFFYNQLTKKIPREKIYSVAYLLCIVSYVLMFAIFFVLKPGSYLINTVLVSLSGACLMLANGMNQIGSTVMIADVVDYGEYKTGKRGDSVIFSVQTLLTKFAAAAAMLILGLGITAAGLPSVTELPIVDEKGAYVETVNVYTDGGKYLIGNEETWDKVTSVEDYRDDAEFIEGEIISTKSLSVLRVFMFLIPIPLTVAGLYFYKKKYTLFGERYDEIKAAIDERRKNGENKEQ